MATRQEKTWYVPGAIYEIVLPATTPKKGGGKQELRKEATDNLQNSEVGRHIKEIMSWRACEI